ncbi:MAG TPA: tripartite tricarboxylate transporter substrate binding protein [Pseudolabrys sp.]|nr:tripartite tricarboxylate transporter substrate binding protein [Pseudolabrys sp.]
MRILTTSLVALAALFTATGGDAKADYPTKAVKIIVPFAPGGPTDVMARLVAQKLSDNLKHQFYIDNQAGAGGNIGMGNAAKSPNDGYTLLFVSSSFVVNPSLFDKIPYDPFKDFQPISKVGFAPNILVVHPSLPAKSVKELIDLLRSNPGKYSFASPGTGTTPHLSGELFKLTDKLDMVHVPFPGAGPAIQSTVGGHTLIAFTSLPPTVAHVNEGKLRGLAVTAKKRSGALPDVPTLAEAGLPNQEADTMQALLAPAGIPKDVLDTLHSQIVKILADPDVQKRFAQLGFEPVGNSPSEFTQEIKEEIEKWRKVINDAKIKK